VTLPSVNQRTNKDGGTVYFVRTRDAGGKQTSETFATRRQAEAFAKRVTILGGAAAIAERNRRDRAQIEYVPTLAEWLPRHIAMLTGVEDRTRLDYAAMAARTFLPLIGDQPLDAIDRAGVADVVNALDRRGLSAKSIANAHGLLSSTLATAVTEGIIETNPCYRMRLPRTREEHRQGERFLTHEEYARLYEHIRPDMQPLVLTMFGTGLRWSELTALEVRDVNAAARPPSLRVTKAWKSTPGERKHIGPPKSAKSRRTVMLPAQVVDTLAPLLDRPGTDLLFVGRFGKPIHHGSWRERIWVPACIAAGLATPRPDRQTDPRGWKAWTYDGPRIHDARHTHASWLIEQGATLEQVQDQLGHESILTTRKVYGHLQPAMRQTLADAATRALAMGEPAAIEG
jgi:integrase